MKTENRNLVYALIAGIILCSFRFYASCFYPWLNSDDAVSILMLHKLSLPDDLYYWGQDRYGSLIPVCGQFFYKAFQLSPVISESVTHYIFLILGFLGFASFFKNSFTKLTFAIVWFFPPAHMIDLLRYNIGLQCCLIGIAIGLLNSLNNSSALKKSCIYVLLILIFMSAVWVSELAFVSIILLLAILYFSSKKLKQNIFRRWEIYYVIAGTIVTFAFINYAKSHAVKVEQFATFSSMNEIKTAISIFSKSISDLFLFNSEELFTSIYCWLLVAGILVLFFFVSSTLLREITGSKRSNNMIVYFLIDAVAVLVIILISKWSFLNDVPRRYFISCYVSLWMCGLIMMENISSEKRKLLISKLVFAIVFIGGAGTIYNMKFTGLSTLKPKLETVRELEQFGNIGIIGDYWNSYVNCVSNPDEIKATPYDASGSVRNTDLAKEVFQQKSIYIIRDNWMNEFPDSLMQYNHLLVKDGTEMHVADSKVCRYRLE